MGEQPAVSASEALTATGEPPAIRFNLFPSVEEQVEAITQAQAEDRQTAQQQIFTPDSLVPPAVVGRALTSAGNSQHSVERIVAFFQKSPTGSAAASFMRKEFGQGGKGMKIAGQDYAIWFDKEGFRIAPGRSAFGSGSTLVSWVNAAVMVSDLLRDGMFATQDKIAAAPDNEYRELAEKLWYLRQDFNDGAREQNLLPTVSQHFFGKGFPDDTKEIAELLKNPANRQQIVRELAEFVGAHGNDHSLLRFNRIHNPKALFADVVNLFTPRQRFRAEESFAPVRASFITEDEIDRLLLRGGNYEDGKFRIYSYFMQGHNTQECVRFLRDVYGDGGHSFIGFDEWHDSKGIRYTRQDEESGFKGYATIQLNWNQVQKRIRGLIDSGRYLNQNERNELPRYEKFQLAQQINSFFYHDPSSLDRDGSHEWVYELAEKKYLPMLDHPDQVDNLYRLMLSDFAPLSSDTPHYDVMQQALRNVAAYQRGEYSLFTPLPEAVLQAERQARQAEKEAKQAKQAQHTPPTPREPEGKLAAAARALGKKMQSQAAENDDGQISFDLFSAPVPEHDEPPAAPQAEEESSRPPWWDELNEVRSSHPDSIILYQLGDFFELYGEDAKTAAALLGLTLTTRPIAGVGRVDVCGFPAHELERYVEKLRESHAITLMPVDAQTLERRVETLERTGAEKAPTIGELYEKYAPAVKNLVLADKAYQSACINSDRENAYLEGGEAILRAALTIGAGDMVFLRLYSDSTEFHDRLHREITDETYPMLSRPQQRQAAPLSAPTAGASAAPQQPKRRGRTKPELNYRTLSKLFPETVSGEYRYLKLEAGVGMMPLHLEWIGEDEIAVSHTYVQNGDLMRDPEMTFRMDREKGSLEPLTFRQDGGIPIYQEVYPEPGKWIPKLRSDLNTFAQQWFKNISEQGYLKRSR